MILRPALERLIPTHPDVHVEVSIEHRFVDIVAERFDAGIGPARRSSAT